MSTTLDQLVTLVSVEVKPSFEDLEEARQRRGRLWDTVVSKIKALSGADLVRILSGGSTAVGVISEPVAVALALQVVSEIAEDFIPVEEVDYEPWWPGLDYYWREVLEDDDPGEPD